MQWRPSRLLCALLLLIATLAACSVLASEMPRPVAWPLAVAALLHGLHLARRHWRSPPHELLFRNGELSVDGVKVEQAEVSWRGPLSFVSWRDAAGRRRRLSLWQDVLPPARRRELRLAAPGGQAARDTASVAP